jgi:uncharacterized membrane protein
MVRYVEKHINPPFSCGDCYSKGEMVCDFPMNPMRSLKLWQLPLAVAVALTTQVAPPTILSSGVGEQPALARSSGGRSGGGSFNRSSGNRPSGGSYSNPSTRQDSSSFDRQPYNRSYGGGYGGYSRGYGGYGGYGYGSPIGGFGLGSLFGPLVLLLLLGGGIGWVILAMLKSRSSSTASYLPELELTNDIVTVTKVQVAMTAQARYIQSELTALSQSVDTSTQDGLTRLLQESCLALVRSPEYWTHVLSSSDTVRTPMEGQELFNKLSITERSKLDVESLVNVGGSQKTQALKLNPEEDPAAYVVVTLLIGTAHDKPLFPEPLRTSQSLQDALSKLAALPPEYLMVLEVIWSPQDEKDSLTEEELLTEYSGMMQI